MKKLTMLLGLMAGLAAAQTTTQYNLTRGGHNSPATWYQSQAVAYNSLNTITVYDAAGDRVETGGPYPQWDPIAGQGLYCINVVQWTVADYPGISPNGQVWTFSCPNSSGATVITGTFYTTWTIISFVEGGKGGSHRYYEKQYTLQATAGVDDMGNPITSNVQIMQ